MAIGESFVEAYIRSSGAVAYIAIIDENGDEGIGTAFHIGDGVFVTARHVVENVTIKDLATTKSSIFGKDNDTKSFPPRRMTIENGPFFSSDNLDVAVFKVNLGDIYLPKISVSDHSQYNFGENQLVLSDVLIIGYPPIPFTTVPNQVVATAQINAAVRLHHSPALHFIVSAMARGGFSGGVALDKSGVAIGLVTESLGTSTMAVENGFMSVLSIEHAIDLAGEIYGFCVSENYPGRASDAILAAKFIKDDGQSLSSFIYDADIYIYDDDRDLFIEITCDDIDVKKAVVAAVAEITPLDEHTEQADGTWFFTPSANPPARVLRIAGQAAIDCFESHGYRLSGSEQSIWQIKIHSA